MQKIRKLFSLFLAILMLASILPISSEATAPESVNFTIAYTNPLYDGLVSPKQSAPPLKADPSAAPQRSVSYGSTEYVTDIDEAAAILRAGMVAREPSISIKFSAPATCDLNALLNGILERALSHTGVPYEGDYLRWQYGGFVMGYSGTKSNGTCYLTLTYSLQDWVNGTWLEYEYYTTAEQEAAVTAKLKEVIAGFGFTDHTTDYYKVQTVYEYIMQGCTYGCNNDSEHPDQAFCSCTSKHSAYAALIDGKAVCQGYALLLYRMLMECGVDCRLIAGVANNGLKTEGHAWNIVKLDGKWYNLDATWDDDNPALPYFLKSNNNRTFNNSHFRDDDYKTTAFNAAYPMAESDYVFGDLDDSGSLTTVDLTLLLRHLANIQPLSQAALAHADFYADGNITAADATALASLLS